MLWSIKVFFQDNSDTIRIVGGIVVMLAGVIVMVYHTLIGLLMLFGGMIWAILAVNKIMRSGGYNGHAGGNFGGMGQQQSGVIKDNNPGAVSEIDPGIWGTMTDDKPDK